MKKTHLHSWWIFHCYVTFRGDNHRGYYMGQGWNRKDNGQGEIVSTAFEDSFFFGSSWVTLTFWSMTCENSKCESYMRYPPGNEHIPFSKAFRRWLFLFPKWDMLVSWKVFRYSRCTYHIDTQIHNDIHVIWCRPKCLSYVLQTSALSTLHLCPETPKICWSKPANKARSISSSPFDSSCHDATALKKISLKSPWWKCDPSKVGDFSSGTLRLGEDLKWFFQCDTCKFFKVTLQGCEFLSALNWLSFKLPSPNDFSGVKTGCEQLPVEASIKKILVFSLHHPSHLQNWPKVCDFGRAKFQERDQKKTDSFWVVFDSLEGFGFPCYVPLTLN